MKIDKDTLYEMLALINIDLSDYPTNRYMNLYSKLDWKSFDLSILKEDDVIIRARVNKDDSSFTNVNDLSFVPQHLNRTYQRASTPNKTMFYGCYIPFNFTQTEFDNALLSAAFEVLNIYDPLNLEEITRKKVTFGIWKFNTIIPLPVIMTFKEFLSGQNHANFHEVRTWLIMPDAEEMKTMDTCMIFLKHHFTKKVKFDYEYVPSAIFTEYLLLQGYKGIYYPGMKTEFDTYNVALTPDVITRGDLFLDCAMEANVYFKKGIYIIEKVASAQPVSDRLNYETIGGNRTYLSSEKVSELIDDYIKTHPQKPD